MVSRLKRQPLFWIIVIIICLVMPAAACTVDPDAIINDLISQFINEIEQTIDDWLDEFENSINEWWDNFISTMENAISQWWDEIQQNWDEIWLSLYPPAPTIAYPPDGLLIQDGVVAVSGNGLPGAVITLTRNGSETIQTTVNVEGDWRVDTVTLTQGDNVFVARARLRLFNSPASTPVTVQYPGEQTGSIPLMVPFVDPDLDPHSWMTEVALAQLRADGEMLFESNRQAYVRALQDGLAASAEDEFAHQFINTEFEHSFDEYLLVFLIPLDTTAEEVFEALAIAIESSVVDEGVQQQLFASLQSSYEELDLTWVIEDGSESFSFQYVQFELDREIVLNIFDPSSLAKFKAKLATELVAGLLSEIPGQIVEEAVKMGFALWGRADADSQAQHYYELAIRAWNHSDLDGTPLPWDDALENGLDGDLPYAYDTNEEWGLFYLGRSVYYAQQVADPYYTIPYYKPEADLYSYMAGRIVKYYAEQRITKAAEAVFGKVIGGGGPLVKIVALKEVFNWLVAFRIYADANLVVDEHRPNFGDFVAGTKYAYPVSDGLKLLGVGTDVAGYPFRRPSDIMLHYYLEAEPLPLAARSASMSAQFDVLPLLNDGRIGWSPEPVTPVTIRRLVRSVGLHAAQYVHPGYSIVLESDARIPEGDLIYQSPYYIREIFTCHQANNPLVTCWNVPQESRIRLTLLDGTIIEGTIDYLSLNEQIRYVVNEVYAQEVAVKVLGLTDLDLIAGVTEELAFTTISVISLLGDETHLYAVMDAARTFPFGANPNDVPTIGTALVGIAGNHNGPTSLDEWDGAAYMATDRLLSGTRVTHEIFKRFALEAAAYQPPPPVVAGPHDFVVSLGSPANLHVYDQSGRHVGLTPTGDIEVEIPDAIYYTSPYSGEQIIFITDANSEDSYAIQVDGTGSGAFDLGVYYSDRSHNEGVHISYEDIPLTAATAAKLELAPGSSTPGSLQVDANADGTFEEIYTPTDIQRTYQLALASSATRRFPIWIILTGVVITAGFFGLRRLGRQRSSRWRQAGIVTILLFGIALTILFLTRAFTDENRTRPDLNPLHDIEAPLLDEPGSEGETAPSRQPPGTPATGPQVIVKVNLANVRQGPGTDYPVIATVERETALAILAVSVNRDWYLVALSNNQRGWIGGSVVEPNQPTTNLPAATAAPLP